MEIDIEQLMENHFKKSSKNHAGNLISETLDARNEPPAVDLSAPSHGGDQKSWRFEPGAWQLEPGSWKWEPGGWKSDTVCWTWCPGVQYPEPGRVRQLEREGARREPRGTIGPNISAPGPLAPEACLALALTLH